MTKQQEFLFICQTVLLMSEARGGHDDITDQLPEWVTLASDIVTASTMIPLHLSAREAANEWMGCCLAEGGEVVVPEWVSESLSKAMR